jgi:hypothetical protein
MHAQKCYLVYKSPVQPLRSGIGVMCWCFRSPILVIVKTSGPYHYPPCPRRHRSPLMALLQPLNAEAQCLPLDEFQIMEQEAEDMKHWLESLRRRTSTSLEDAPCAHEVFLSGPRPKANERMCRRVISCPLLSLLFEPTDHSTMYGDYEPETRCWTHDSRPEQRCLCPSGVCPTLIEQSTRRAYVL